MADSLGEYKVVVTADYSQLQEQMKNISKLVSETANGMTNAMSNATSSLNANIAKAMDDMNANIAKAMGTMQSTLNKELKLDNIKVDTSGVEKGFNDTIKKMNEATDAARKFSNTVDGAGGGSGSSKVTDDFESYAKQIKQATKEAEKLHQEIQRLKSSLDSKSASKFSNLIPDIDTRVVEARLAETEKKFDDIRRKIDQLKQAQADYNNNINKTELAAKEVDKALQQQVRDKEKIDKQNAKMLEGEQKIAQEQQARIEKENEKRQRQINSLNNAYRRLYDNINSYVATNTQMTEKQFYRYQTALSALQAKMQSLGSFLPSHAIQNMSYASYHEPFRIADDNKKNQEAIRKLGEEYERVYRNINSYIETNTKMLARQFYTFNEGIQRLRESVIALGQTPDFKNPLANMNYAEYAKGFDTVSAAVTKANKQTGFFIDTLKSLKHHMTWMASGAVMMTAFAIPATAVRSIAEVEKEMAGFRQVNHEANESQEVLNETSEKFINIAQRYGMSVDEIIKAGVLWGRGYKDINTVMQLTSVSAKLAVADMMDVGLANRAVESVINSFQMQGEAVEFANHVVDSWTKVAHNAQSSAKDLADAMMRSAAAAKAVGIDFDTATALASTMIKTTGLAGATIGESMKSLFSSIHSKKAIQSLHDLGIEVYKFDEDGTRHFRDVQSVLIDLMTTSHTTSRNMEKDLLAISGGKFQWSKVASVLGDYKDFIHAYNLSIQSSGFSQGQIAAQLDTISKRFEQLKATITGLFTNVGNSGLSAAIKDIIVKLNYFFRALQNVSHGTYSFLMGMGTFATVLIGMGMTFKAVASSVINVKNAINAAKGATVANTAAISAETAAQEANNVAKGVGAVAARSETAAVAAGTVAQGANAAATTAAATATSAWATAMTIATAGINIIIAMLAVAVAAFMGYNTIVGESIAIQDREKEALENKEQAQRQEIEMMEKQNRFIDVLGKQHIKLTNAINSNTLSEEKNKKAKEDLEATDKELAKIIGEDGVERIKTSDDVQGAIKAEKDAHEEKTKAIKQNLIDAFQAQLDYTTNDLEWSKQRVQALQNESDAWWSWANIKKQAMNVYATFAETQAKAQRAMGNTILADQLEEAANNVRNYNPHADEIAEYQKRITDDEAKIAELQAKIFAATESKYGNTGGDSGDLPYGASPEDSASGGKSGRGGSSSVHTAPDNSPQRMAYDALTKAGLTQGMVLGLMGNIQVESGFNPNATSSDGYYGLLQWGGSRLQDLKNFANQVHGDFSSMETQLAFIVYELTHSQGKERNAYNYIMANSHTPEEFAHNIDQKYVRSDQSTDWDRQKAAREYHTKYALGDGSKKNYDDPMKQLHDSYEVLLKNFKAACEEGKQKALEMGQAWTKLDEKILFDKTFGENGSNIDYSKGLSTLADVGATVAKKAQEHPTGEQWIGTVTDNVRKQCDSFTARIYKDAGIKSIGGYDTSVTINDDAFRAANALHNYSDVTNGTYKPEQGDMLGWRWSATSGHYGVYDAKNDVVTTRDSSGGVQHRTLAEAKNTWGEPTWIGSLKEALKSPKSVATNSTASSSPFAIDEAYKKEKASVYGNAVKDEQELFDLDQRLKQAKTDAGVDWIHKIEKDIDEIRKEGLPLPKSYLEIYKLREKSKTQTGVSEVTGFASKEKMTTDIAEYEKIATLRRTAEKAAITATENHTKALVNMAEKELAFAKKLGLVTDQDMLKRNILKNETEYATKSAKVDDKLTKSAYSGKEADMLAEYKNLLMAQSEQESKQAVEHMMLLSKDIEATTKAIEEKMALDQKYYEAKYSYEQQVFEYQNRYTINILDTFTKGWQTAFENTLNKTKSFAENMRDIFNSMWQGVVKLFANDMTTKMHKTIATAVFGNKENGNGAGAMQGHIGAQSIPSSISHGFKLPSLKTIFGGSKKSKTASVASEFTADTLGSGLSLLNFGGKSKGKKGSSSFVFDTNMFTKNIKKASSSWKSFQNTMASNMKATQQTCNMAVNDMANKAVQADNTKQSSSSITAAAVQSDAKATQTSVSASISAMVTQMLAAMAIMWAMSALFGGGGSHTSTSTSEVNLGRSPDSYYMTPTAVTQSTSYTVPSMDIGGNIEKDMLIYAHKNEMVLTPEQAGVIRSVASHGGVNGGSGSNTNAHVKSNINVSTVDSKGFDRVLRNYNRDLSKQVKKGIRNGYLTTNGLV